MAKNNDFYIYFEDEDGCWFYDPVPFEDEDEAEAEAEHRSLHDGKNRCVGRLGD